MKVDEKFSEFYPFETTIIEQLVSIEREKRPSVEQLLTIYAKEIQQRMKKHQNNTKQMIIEQLQEKLRDKDKRIQQLELELEKNKL
jgi:low affinity Fe/Cu permease